MPLILEPDRWEKPATLELEETLHAGLAAVLNALEMGQLPFPSPEVGATAMELLRTVLALHEATPRDSDLRHLVALVNVQYQTVIAVMALVPSHALEERTAKKKKAEEQKRADAHPPK